MQLVRVTVTDTVAAICYRYSDSSVADAATLTVTVTVTVSVTLTDRYSYSCKGVCGEFGCVGFLTVCFLYKIKPNPRKNIRCGKKWPKCHF